MGVASSASVSATVVKPAAETRGTAPYQSSKRANGTVNTAPMATLTARRYSGSAHLGANSTASMPRAAALRKAAPTFV
jgi:hypothetical protein